MKQIAERIGSPWTYEVPLAQNVCQVNKALYEIMMFVGNQLAKSHEILMFVCLQKDAKQCCEVTKLDGTHCSGLWLHLRPEQ